MNKAELAARLADKTGVSKKLGEDFVAAFQEIVTNELVNGGEVTIAGFGTFSARARAGRMGVNPQNPSEPMKIPSVTVPKFKAGSALKKSLKDKGETSAPSTPEPTPEASAPSA